MRRLQHLSGIERMMVGIILLHLFRYLAEYRIDRIAIDVGQKFRQICKTLVEGQQGFSEGFDIGGVEHVGGSLP
jgi:hypothetical protein